LVVNQLTIKSDNKLESIFMLAKLSQLPNDVRQYMLVTFNYWNFTLTDGALRMLVVLHFHQLGYSPLEIASLFLFYEFFGVVTNLIGGWLGAQLGLNKTMNIGLFMQVIAFDWFSRCSYCDGWCACRRIYI
jgi:MFS-type transporter involved in bile tolerance (Atg22 family)